MGLCQKVAAWFLRHLVAFLPQLILIVLFLYCFLLYYIISVLKNNTQLFLKKINVFI